MNKAKPPDLYKSKVGILKNVVKDPEALRRIQEAVIRMNHITITAYQFIKAYCLFQVKESNPVPIIDEEFIKLCIKTVTTGSNAGPKMKAENAQIYERLKKYYTDHFNKVLADAPLSKTKLNQIIGFSATSMLTGFENNIKVHFCERLFRYVNAVFFHQHKEVFDALPQNEKKAFTQNLRAELKKVKNDLLSGSLSSDQKYHEWIMEQRGFCVPHEFQISVAYDVKCEPMKYLPFMINMSNNLESIGRKIFSSFPLRTDIVPKSIVIDTAALLELMIDENSNKYRQGENAIRKAKDELWGKFFHLDAKLFRYGGKQLEENKYLFEGTITTNGVSISPRFVSREFFNKRKPKQNKKVSMEPEFKYLDEHTEEALDQLRKEYTFVYVDPNKSNLIFCIDNYGNTFRYTRKQRLQETQRIHNQKVTNKYKKEKKVHEVETEVSKHNGKTCNYEDFMKYLKVKNEANAKLFPVYEEVFLRKMKLRTYINTQRSEAKLIDHINMVFKQTNKKIALMYGDCNVGKQMRHIISTPMIGLKRLLAKYFLVINIDEFRTSCLDWRTEKYNDNVTVKGKDGKNKKLHAVLVSQILNKSNTVVESFNKVYQNRDLNSVKNIRKIVKQYMKDRTRPYRYRRDVELE